MTTQNVIISPLILSHYIKPRTERQRLIYHQTCPWGIYAATRPRVWPWLLHAASLSAIVQDQRLVRSLVFDTIFSIFCSTVTEDIWKHALVWFWKALCVLNLPHRWLCVARRLLLPQMEEAGREMAEVEPLLPVSELGAIPSTRFPAHVSVSSWHAASRVCLFYLGTHMLCFWFDMLPVLSCVYQWGRRIWNTKIHQAKSDGMSPWKYESLCDHEQIYLLIISTIKYVSVCVWLMLAQW